MALAEICGLNNFDYHNKETLFENDILRYSKNLTNNVELAVPPFYNVSLH